MLMVAAAAVLGGSGGGGDGGGGGGGGGGGNIQVSMVACLLPFHSQVPLLLVHYPHTVLVTF
jgi:hypothetical protein